MIFNVCGWVKGIDVLFRVVVFLVIFIELVIFDFNFLKIIISLGIIGFFNINFMIYVVFFEICI